MCYSSVEQLRKIHEYELSFDGFSEQIEYSSCALTRHTFSMQIVSGIKMWKVIETLLNFFSTKWCYP